MANGGNFLTVRCIHRNRQLSARSDAQRCRCERPGLLACCPRYVVKGSGLHLGATLVSPTTMHCEPSRQFAESDSPQACDQERFCFSERIFYRSVDGLFDRAVRIAMFTTDGEYAGATYRAVDIEQRNRLQIRRDRPATAMPLFGPDISCIAQARHCAANDDGVRPEHPRDGLGRHRAIVTCHVEQNVEHS